MSEYKTIFGKAVKALASDPTDAGAEGQIWYNTTTGSFRTVLATSAWSSGAPLSTARDSLAGAGTQTLGLAFGGGNPGDVTATEEYNGSGWASGGALNTARRLLAGAGTQTAGLAFAGGPPNVTATEEYDGSSWTTSPGSMSTARRGLGGAGIQTAAIGFGGFLQLELMLQKNTMEQRGLQVVI